MTSTHLDPLTAAALESEGLTFADLDAEARRVVVDFDFGDLSWRNVHAYLTRRGLIASPLYAPEAVAAARSSK